MAPRKLHMTSIMAKPGQNFHQSVDQCQSFTASHQVPDFSAIMHRIQFWLGLRPGPAGGAYSSPPDPLCLWAGVWWPTAPDGVPQLLKTDPNLHY